MNRNLTTREATVADVPTIVRHRRAMFESMGMLDPARNDAMDAAATAYLAKAIPRGEYRGWLVETPSGEVIAGAGLSIMQRVSTPYNLSGQFAYLMSLYVEPGYRRQGIARHLMRTMIAWSVAQGITDITLHASEQGRPLYDSLGFEPTTEMRLLIDR